MVDEQEPPKRVVKRVVKKTVARPTAPQPTIRYGRPVATATKPPQAKAAPATTKTKTTSQTAPSPKAKPARPTVDVRANLGTAGHRIGDAWWVVADGTRDASRHAATFLAARSRAAAAWRLPHINLYLASVITGAISGLAAVALGAVSLQLFEQVRGVSTGGGLWGGVAFLVIAAFVTWLGGAFLAGFGAPSPRLRSLLAVIVSVVAILGLFLDSAQSVAGILIVPALGIAAFAAAHWLMDQAENTPPVID